LLPPDFVATIIVMVRPLKADSERKSMVLRVRMTQEDRKLLDTAADSDGLDTSAWARNVLLRSAKRKATTITAKWVDRDGARREPETSAES